MVALVPRSSSSSSTEFNPSAYPTPEPSSSTIPTASPSPTSATPTEGAPRHTAAAVGGALCGVFVLGLLIAAALGIPAYWRRQREKRRRPLAVGREQSVEIFGADAARVRESHAQEIFAKGAARHLRELSTPPAHMHELTPLQPSVARGEYRLLPTPPSMPSISARASAAPEVTAYVPPPPPRTFWTHKRSDTTGR